MCNSQATLIIYQGDDYAADVTVMGEDGITPADLTGYTAQSQIRTGVEDTSPNGVAQFEITINNNVLTLVLGHDVTKTLSKGAYVWDLQLIDANDWITTIMFGQVQVPREVTKVATGSIKVSRVAVKK